MSESRPSPILVAVYGEHRGILAALGGLALLLLIAHATTGTAAGYLAALALVGVPLIASRLEGRAPAVFLLAGALGAWLAFRPLGWDGHAASGAVILLRRAAYFAAPPLALGLALSRGHRQRFGLGPVHLYAPAVVMGLAAVAHLVLTGGREAVRSEMDTAATVYAVCYATLIVVALLLRLEGAGEPKAKAPVVTRAVEMEEQGRFAVASRAYEREGDPSKAAEMAERAGEWARAGRLYRAVENDAAAAEMFARAEQWPQALEAYERAGDLGAAARVSLRLGHVEKAIKLCEKAGDPAELVRTLEAAGRRPTTDQYRKAGMPARAAAVLEEAGDWAGAAAIYEHEMGDPDRAVAACLRGGCFLDAGRLLESQGRSQEALEAYAAAPDGAADAARLYLVAGRPGEAADMFAQVRAEQLDRVQDEATLTGVARVMVDARRNEEALRILQNLKRRGAAGGLVHLLLGRVFLAKKMPELAEAELQAARALPLDGASEMEAAYSLACVLENLGKKDEAAAVFHDILQKDFRYADAEARYRRLKAGAPPPAAAGD